MTTDKHHIRVVAAEIVRDGRYLIAQRRPEATMPLLWEFPGGRVEPGETDEAALVRELKEIMGVDLEVGELCLHVVHEYEKYTIDLLVYRATMSGPPQLFGVHDVRWVRADEFDHYEFPAADQQTIEALLGL